jgi:hypothetical protein
MDSDRSFNRKSLGQLSVFPTIEQILGNQYRRGPSNDLLRRVAETLRRAFAPKDDPVLRVEKDEALPRQMGDAWW